MSGIFKLIGALNEVPVADNLVFAKIYTSKTTMVKIKNAAMPQIMRLLILDLSGTLACSARIASITL